jgi:CRISPR-associated protein Cas1
MRTILQRANRQAEQAEITMAIKQLGETISKVDKLEADNYPPPDPSRPQLNTAWGQLLGLEGSGSACYFGVLGLLLKHGWVFTKRVRRPPTDPVNAMLSYGYTLLTNQVASAVQVVGLDPYIGFLHGSKYSKPSLALDMMEEFRPIIVDSLVLTLINKKIIKPDDFEETLGAFHLTDTARKTFLQQYEARLSEEITHPTFDYKVTYRQAIEKQVRLLARWLHDELESYPPFLVR